MELLLSGIRPVALWTRHGLGPLTVYLVEDFSRGLVFVVQPDGVDTGLNHALLLGVVALLLRVVVLE